MSKSKTQDPKAQWQGATPQRKDGIGPSPEALREGKINPAREGKVFAAIRDGVSTVSELMAATGLRNPTAKHFGISAAEAGLIDSFRIGLTYHFVPLATDTEATANGKAKRAAVLALVESAKTTK